MKNIDIQLMHSMRRLMSAPHSIDESMVSRSVDMSIIFATDSDKKAIKNDAMLYQDILWYGLKCPDGFKSTEIGNWLLVNNTEFSNDFSGSRARIPNRAKLALKRHRVERHLDNLVALDIIYKKKWVKSEKNQSYTPVYTLTESGNFNRIQAAYGPYPCATISEDCPGCGKFRGTCCHVLQLPYFVTSWGNTAKL